MAWPEISIEDLPPERDDEPASLRQDILDELTDHFTCALNRELLKNPDEQTAKQRVLNQFGDPIKIARQLWLDAMKEKIMSQRIMTGVSVVMAVCCLTVLGIAWSMMKESQAFNLQILEQFKESNNNSQSETAGALHSISFQLVQNEVNGKPAVNFSGKLSKIENRFPVFTIDATSDKNGKLDFGKLPWGTYNIDLVSPWQESCIRFSITTLPGRAYEQEIICPGQAPQSVPVKLEIDWADQPEGQAYIILCDFRYKVSTSYSLIANRILQDNEWTFQYDLGKGTERGVYLVDVKNNQIAPCPLTVDGDFKAIKLQKLDWEPTVNFPEGKYISPAIYLIRKSELAKLTELNSMKHISVISRIGNQMSVRLQSPPYLNMIISPFEAFHLAPGFLRDLKKNTASLFDVSQEGSPNADEINGLQANKDFGNYYVARKDKPNLWKIQIPDLDPITKEFGSSSSAP